MRIAFTRQESTPHTSSLAPKSRPGTLQQLPVGRDPTGYVPPDQHHFISPSRNSPIRLTEFLSQTQGDPALKVLLTSHLFLFLDLKI